MQDRLYEVVRGIFAYLEEYGRLNDLQLAEKIREEFGTGSPVIDRAIKILEEHAQEEQDA